jgi:hypothetical protein
MDEHEPRKVVRESLSFTVKLKKKDLVSQTKRN